MNQSDSVYDMSSNVITIVSMNETVGSVKLSWPAIIRDIQSVYVVEGRAPQLSHVWKVHAAGLFATSCIIKGLDLCSCNYEFRVRTKSTSGLGEPSQTATTSAFRPTGDTRANKSTTPRRRLSSSALPTNISGLTLHPPSISINTSSVAPPISPAVRIPGSKTACKPYSRSNSGPASHRIRAQSVPKFVDGNLSFSKPYHESSNNGHLCVGMAAYEVHRAKTPLPSIYGAKSMSYSCISYDY